MASQPNSAHATGNLFELISFIEEEGVILHSRISSYSAKDPLTIKNSNFQSPVAKKNSYSLNEICSSFSSPLLIHHQYLHHPDEDIQEVEFQANALVDRILAQ